jgi:hypothetical protein
MVEELRKEVQDQRRQPWKVQWPPRGPTLPASSQAKEGEAVIILDTGGGAYPNRMKETEGTRL